MDLHPELSERERDGIRLLVDEAAAEAGWLVAFTDRHGGASESPYDTLNLGGRVGDDAERVNVNRKRAAAASGFDIDALALSRQVHGCDVREVGRGDSGVVGEADVMVARAPGVAIGILTADCAPVTLAGERGIAIAHAGWRGLVGGAIEAGVDAVGPVHAAWVGPSIRACCYEVGPDVIEAFERNSLPVAAPDRVDTGAAAVAILERAGIERIACSPECTFHNDRYFSFRRDGVTGRQGAFAAMLAL